MPTMTIRWLLLVPALALTVLGAHFARAGAWPLVVACVAALVVASARFWRWTIGSRRTQAARRTRLRELGLDEEQVTRLRGPIGLDLGGREPAETL